MSLPRVKLLLSWLFRSVGLSYLKEAIRLEIFIMATLMAFTKQTSLPPMVLVYNYHGLEEAVSRPDNAGKANAIFCRYFVTGWLAKLFPCLYCRRSYSNCPSDFPTFVHYVRSPGSKLSLPQVRHVLKDGKYLSIKGSSYREVSRNGGDVVVDMGQPMRILNFFCLLGPLYFLYALEPN